MHRVLGRLAAVFAVAALSLTAHATDIPVGFLSYDVTGPNVAQFDIVNLTGPNSSGDASFPITTSVMLSSLTLTVDFAGGGSHTFDSSYFTLDGDGLSFDGEQLSTLAGPPTGLFNAIDATLTGTFSPEMVTLFDGSSISIAPNFSVSIGESKETLQDGDLGVINAVQTPEPATWTMVGTGLIGLVSLMGAGVVRRTARRLVKSNSGVALGVGFALLMAPVSSKAVTVKLNSLTSPATGAAGASTVSVTGSGFPSGTIAPANVFVSLSATCGGSPTTTTASTVQKILGTEAKVSFAVPGSLAAGTYFVSVNGIDSNEVDFTSGTSCSTLQVVPGPSPTLTIDTTNAKDWKISNGALMIDFNPTDGNVAGSSTTSYANIFGITPVGTTDNLIDLTNRDSSGPKGFYMDNAGFGVSSAFAPGFVNTGSYIDWWVTYPSNSSNAYTFSEHWVMTPNDSGIHVYYVTDHSASDIAGSVGQVQWVIREDLNKFPNVYSVNPDLSNPGPIAIPLPSSAEYFSTDKGRAVQDATVDLHGFTDIPAGFGRFFGDKYDYSGYSYLNVAHGVYGSQYGAWVVFPSNESLVGGPTKQDLLFTGNLDMIEPYSNHLDNALSLASPAGVATHRLYGPFYVRFNKFGGNIQTADDMYKDAVIAGTSFGNFYDNEAQLVAAGYVPSSGRGTVQLQVNRIASGISKTAWAVLSDPGKNIQFSAQGAQYWQDISATGAATFNGVIPGTYRLSVYNLGQWGEVRQENITVTAGQNLVVPPFNFVQENFGTGAPLFTIGTADRSSHEFLHGHDAAGHDDREFWGNWNYWADFAANQGAVVYNATAGPAGAATNDPNKWNYNQWQTFDPGLYGGVFSSGDDTTDGYTFAIPPYVAALPTHAGTNGVTTRTPPWTVHFATPQNAGGSSFAVLSVALAAAEASLTVTLNGQPLVWHEANASDAAVRSGLSGYTQWVALQWDSSVLNPAGADNVLTFSVSQTQGVEWDAMRMELTNATADPAVTGWHDYEFVYKTTDTKPNDSVPNP